MPAMRHDPIDSELFKRNRQRLREKLPKQSIVIIRANDIMPTNADGTMPYMQNNDLYYLTGIAQEDTFLILLPDAVEENEREILFVKETNKDIAIWDGEKLSKEQARQQSGIKCVEWSHGFDRFLHRLIPQANHIFLSTNEHLRAATTVETANDRLIRDIQARYPLHDYRRLAPLMHRLRMIKDSEEMKWIQKACDITESGFRRVLSFIKPDVTEWEIEAELAHEYLRNGSRGFAYTPIIGSGKNACVLHYLDNHDTCRDGELVLMDCAAEYAGWMSDLTRTVPVNGRFSERQRAVYDAVLRVYRGANDLLRPGNTPSRYHKQVVELMQAELIQLGLIDAKEAKNQDETKALVKKYFMHGTSHHMGLDVHDVAPPHEPFAEGMVMTIEPGIYIREEKLGVRLENDVVIGRDSNFDFMQNTPIEADEIEDLMNPA